MKKIYIRQIGNINIAYKQKDGTFKYVSEDVKEGQILYYNSIEKTVKTGVAIGTSVSYKYTIYLNGVNNTRFIVPLDLIDLSKSGLSEDGKPIGNTGNSTGGGTGNTGSGTGSEQGSGSGFGLFGIHINPLIVLVALYVILK